jgi:uncharacterized protein with FMN-binding domain
MRRIVIWLASTVTIVVLLFGYHTSTDKTSSAATASSSGPTASAGSQPSSSPSSSSSGSSGDDSSKISTYTGSVAQTRWGPVQVKITVQSGKITKVTVLQQPNGNQKDAEINSFALPILIDETVQTQSANIDMVSGATVTSEGYAQSLQGALMRLAYEHSDGQRIGGRPHSSSRRARNGHADQPRLARPPCF